MNYKAEYEDGNFELLFADNDSDALQEAYEYEDEHGFVFNVFRIDDDYNELYTVL
jgi:hypothetical protein